MTRSAAMENDVSRRRTSAAVASVSALLDMNGSASPSTTSATGAEPERHGRSPTRVSPSSANGTMSPVPMEPERCRSGTAPDADRGAQGRREPRADPRPARGDLVQPDRHRGAGGAVVVRLAVPGRVAAPQPQRVGRAVAGRDVGGDVAQRADAGRQPVDRARPAGVTQVALGDRDPFDGRVREVDGGGAAPQRPLDEVVQGQAGRRHGCSSSGSRRSGGSSMDPRRGGVTRGRRVSRPGAPSGARSASYPASERSRTHVDDRVAGYDDSDRATRGPLRRRPAPPPAPR